MPRVRIKQLDERVASSGIHMGGGPERRKLHPGEVVELPEGELFDAVWATGKLELTMDPATRPLDFLNAREAKLTAPTFKSRGPDEDRQVDEAWANVHARMAAEAVEPEPDEAPVAEQPASEPPPAGNAGNRRAQRRRAAQRATHDEQETAA